MLCMIVLTCSNGASTKDLFCSWCFMINNWWLVLLCFRHTPCWTLSLLHSRILVTISLVLVAKNSPNPFISNQIFKTNFCEQRHMYSLLVYCTTIHCNTVGLSIAKPFKQFSAIYFIPFETSPLCTAWCSIEPRFFLDTSKEWREEYHTFVLSHFYFFLICHLS